MINIRTARRGVVVLALGLALAATGSAAVAAPRDPERTIEWRIGLDGYTTSFVGEYFSGKYLDAGIEWRSGLDGYKTSFVGEYFSGKGLDAGS
jgi:hypothetical protein